MISCIIPVFNRENFIRAALTSVLAQTRLPEEIIVVDDGSTDSSAEIIHQIMQESLVPIHYHYQENQGPAAARNLGIKKAAGDYLIFLDSDDRFEKKKIELQLAAMLENPKCRLSHTDEKWLRNGRHLNKKKRHIPGSGDIFFRGLGLCVVGMSTVMVKKEIFAEYGLFDESLPCCEDYDFWLRVSAFEPFLLVDRKLTVKYGGRADQVSAIHRVGMDVYRIKSLEKFISDRKLLRNKAQYRAVIKECIRKCEIYGKGCLKHDKPNESRLYLQKAEKYRAIIDNQEQL
ncbi:MAG: glycosyl transferase family A [Deltaproteobacteria bacterium]|nr:MAG: glycosyl transferase family A [Deltaproteobacteria bacterium]